MHQRLQSNILLALCLGVAACGSNPADGSPRDAGTGPGPDLDIALPVWPNGVGAELPAVYPDAILCPEDGSDGRCGPGFDPSAALAPAALQATLEQGLEAWHYAGVGGACASCHSPDAIELSRVGYADCDILRRALDHVDAQRADQIVGLVHAMRQVYDVQRPLHPDRFRPLQPGYVPLGEVHSDVDAVDEDLQNERDLAFMNHLTQTLDLTWATERITSLAMAQQAYAELLAIDLSTLPLGIPFDRLSEDPDTLENSCRSIAGPAHTGRSIFEWFPDIPTAPVAGREDEWLALQTAYIEDPTTENLWAYYDRIDELTTCDRDLSHEGDPDYYQPACEWMRMKYKSLQVFQHMLRHGTRAHPDPVIEHRDGNGEVVVRDHIDAIIERSPIWETGDIVRRAPLARRGDPACFSAPAHPCTFLPEDIDESIHSVPSYDEARINQGDLFRMSWVMMGFVRDPTLATHSHRFETFVGDYLESVLLPRYDIHHAFVFTMMAVRKSAAAELMDASGFRRGTGKIASVRTFSFKQVRGNFSPPPESSPRNATHRLMFANFARMFLFLIEADLEASGTIFGRSGTLDGSPSNRGGVLQVARFLRHSVSEIEGAEDPTINALMVSIEALGAAATELRPASDFDDFPGLQPTNRWGAGEDVNFQLPYAP